ncbi:MAG: hypothetical protein LBO69_01410 [Ignavibacteria bacterium]|jgi:hypothetical protein|nr:hypothetical protein [Ignavibacteria bacterium]
MTLEELSKKVDGLEERIAKLEGSPAGAVGAPDPSKPISKELFDFMCVQLQEMYRRWLSSSGTSPLNKVSKPYVDRVVAFAKKFGYDEDVVVAKLQTLYSIARVPSDSNWDIEKWCLKPKEEKK